ncbi:hypothetical protein [Hymenobacter psychrotolerans]|uniref:Uncharacterized protein n=1 Tax=Hymenobacter psychrotolerans DSM 18569 TaxID=1121959 RepID=A0A1M6R5C5_9BACT|nr:hypothetical protein [Hymenobacter psychrotolerans]SHK27689.1 hypothetical protein SAMN02746009_00605 [Hymenobacter psychrotolerans DSM 18569]
MTSEPRPINFLLYLLTLAVVLSVGLNAFLLYRTPEAEDVQEDLSETEAELHMTQRLLARCQSSHQRQDSLLLTLQSTAVTTTSALVEP